MLAEVKIWNIPVGVLFWNNANNSAVFEYHKNFLKNGLDLSPVFLPLSKNENSKVLFSFPYLNFETYKGLPGLFADCLPDKFGNKVIDTWLLKNGRSAVDFNPVNRLCYIGSRAMGALEFEPVVESSASKSEAIEISSLVNFAKKILDERKNISADISKNTTKGLETILQVGSSAGGARAKAIVAYNAASGEMRSGQIDGLTGFDYWLIKFDGVNDKFLSTPKGYGRIEYAYYLMATAAGIEMSECKLLTEKGRAHFMTKRFDRIGNEKIHMQTLCGLAHLDFNFPQANSYEQAFQIMRQLKFPHDQLIELFRRMVFNVMARNQDDHTKNISFLMNKNGEWRLSPAYDITFAYNPTNYWLKAHQMTINGKAEAINIDDVMAVAKLNSIKNYQEIIEQVKAAVLNWKKFAKMADVDVEQQKLISKLIKKI